MYLYFKLCTGDHLYTHTYIFILDKYLYTHLFITLNNRIRSEIVKYYYWRQSYKLMV